MRCHNPDPWEAEAEASQVQVQPGLQGSLVKISKPNNEIVLLFLERFHHKRVILSHRVQGSDLCLWIGDL